MQHIKRFVDVLRTTFKFNVGHLIALDIASMEYNNTLENQNNKGNQINKNTF